MSVCGKLGNDENFSKREKTTSKQHQLSKKHSVESKNNLLRGLKIPKTATGLQFKAVKTIVK